MPTDSNTVALTVEYLSFALSSILYLRNVYPSASFKAVEHAATGLTLQVSNDEGVNGYLGAVLSQVAQWVAQDKLKALSIVIFPDAAPSDGGGGDGDGDGDVVERWSFQFKPNASDASVNSSHAAATAAPQLASALRMLTATTGMLPARKSRSTFEVITYLTPDVFPAPKSWETGDPMELPNADELPLRPFHCGTSIIDGFVTFYGN